MCINTGRLGQILCVVDLLHLWKFVKWSVSNVLFWHVSILLRYDTRWMRRPVLLSRILFVSLFIHDVCCQSAILWWLQLSYQCLQVSLPCALQFFKMPPYFLTVMLLELPWNCGDKLPWFIYAKAVVAIVHHIGTLTMFYMCRCVHNVHGSGHME